MPRRSGVSVGIRAIAHYLPPAAVSVEALHRAGKTESSTALLRRFGFRTARVAHRASAYLLAEKAATRVLRQARVNPEDVEVLIYASALPDRTPGPTVATQPASLFRYPATRLQHDLGMSRAEVIGISQAGCVSFLAATRLARDMILAEPSVCRVLCVSADVLPSGANRELLYNVISDGGCAALVERDASVNRMVAYSQVTRGFYWDSRNKGDEIIVSYFPTARLVIHEVLEKAGLRLDDIGLIVPHNVNRRSWDILLNLLLVPESKFFGRNIARKGHTIAADNMINLQDAVRSGQVRKGDYVLLFTFGFGAHWACLILQH